MFLQMYDYLGKLFGICIRTGVRIGMRLAPIFWKALVEQPLTKADLDSIDNMNEQYLRILLDCKDQKTFAGLMTQREVFVTTLSDGTTRELLCWWE
eukprot:TRINITY_DN10569_c0_g1_i1.p1 TRINITY_DN10569_c0_g1~~TRINITY_DN10569_c0_g1_i1.p1  ORF type:complete len:96 (-),score=0.40 TRINITY_DN10569_c0_g1_i1:139-426(-)